jgi:hypothetical protein
MFLPMDETIIQVRYAPSADISQDAHETSVDKGTVRRSKGIHHLGAMRS